MSNNLSEDPKAPQTLERRLDPLALLSTEDVSGLLGLAPVTLRIWRLNGSGPRFIKIGRNVRYRRVDIEIWIEARAVASTSEIVP